MFVRYSFIFVLLAFSLSSPLAQSSWTGWYDRDDPSGTGDWETLATLGDVCQGNNVVGIEARRTDGTLAQNTGQVISYYDIQSGFACINSDQRNGQQCFDYKVKFDCGFYTRWYDRDDPSGTGDWETLAELNAEFGNVCQNYNIVGIEARRISDKVPAQYIGQVISAYNPKDGFACMNSNQPNGQQCFDYEVRFVCSLGLTQNREVDKQTN